MKNLFKLFFIITALSFTIVSFNDKNKATTQPETTFVIPEPGVDPKTKNGDDRFKFEAGDYNISWEGSPFKTTLRQVDKNTLTGQFCLNNNIINCKELGPITITKNENALTLNFSDIKCRISTDMPGNFKGNGILTKDNEYSFIVNGEDCKRTYTNNSVIFTKI